MKNYLHRAANLTLNLKALGGISIEDATRTLIVVLIFLTPVFSISEIIDLLLARVQSRSSNSTPGYIKAIKDLGFLIIISVSSLKILLRGTYKKHYLIGLCLLLITATGSIFFTIFVAELPKTSLAVIVGIRWMIPFLAIFLIHEIVDLPLINRVAKALNISFYMHLGLQGIQLIFMGGYYGLNRFGLAARVPGFFLIPSTASFFSVLVIFFYLFFTENSKKWKNIMVFLTGFSVIITQSGSGFIVYFLVVSLYYVPKKFLKLSILVAPIFGILLLGIFAFSASRGDEYVEKSGGERIEIFVDVLSNTGIFSSTFGAGTNAARILKTGKLMDSQMASLVYNLGMLFSLMATIFLLSWILIIFHKNDKMIYSFTAIYFLFGAAAIFFEAFPMNLLFSIMCAYLISNRADRGQKALI